MADEASSLGDIFRRIYDGQMWGRGSGPGSSPANTIEYRAFIERFMEANAIRTVTDLGCGDWQFSPLIDWSGVDYLGLDVVGDVIAANQSRFALPHIRFAVLRSIDDLPGGDLLLAKEMLQHLPNRLVAEYLDAIRRKYRFALLTNASHPPAAANRDIEPGGFRPLRLQDPPFNAPGAVVLTYFPNVPNFIWKNAVFLMSGG